ncbi:MAG: sugar ABC transporter ATP-binding protein [Candidatus Atribacteria bacterium]|nr:sugar ABC transporter ATP-binding protein [Candidatus Atribacteria bacterium]
MSIPVLECRGINKSFNGVNVLDNVDFVLEKGEIHALVGQNGAGKSTLMKIINGVYSRDSGEILVEGKEQVYKSAQEARKAGISMVFQDFSLVPTLSVTQNIFLARELSGHGPLLDDRKMEEITQQLLDSIGIDISIHPQELVGNLSVGSKQLVEIAKALSTDSKILIFDEPTASLSQAEISSLFTVIQNLKKKGISIIYISHYLKDIFKLCDSVTVLRDGKNVLSQKISETSLEAVIDSMVGKKVGSQESWEKRRHETSEVPILSVKNLSTDSIRQVSFDLWPGEVLGLAGLLGSGRTEILKALFGLDPIRQGEIFIQGEKVLIRSVPDALRLGLGLVPEDRRNQGLIMDFSINENILLPLLKKLTQLVLIDDQKGQEISREYVSNFKVKCDGIYQFVRYLSGGNQQKVVVAKNVANQPKILLLDDPTFGVDIQSKWEIMHIVKEFANQGNGVLFISSEFGEIASFCDRILLIKNGEVTETLNNTGEQELDEESLLKMVQ